MSKFNPALLVMQPRRIPECLRAIEALDIDKFYLGFMWESQLVPVIASIVEHAPYTHYVILADDGCPTQDALDLVLRHLKPGNHPEVNRVVTGYCNLDMTVAGQSKVNLTDRPFTRLDDSYASDYAWMDRDTVEAWPEELVPSQFAGMALTGMSRDMWLRYPFDVVTRPDEQRGYASDWKLATRLQRDGIPIVAPRGAFLLHVKERLGKTDTDPDKRLLIGVIPPNVRWHRKRGDEIKITSFRDDDGGLPILTPECFAPSVYA